MDFTVEKYRELLQSLKKHNNFSIRHDVDLRPDRSLRLAHLEAEEGLQATYYFRTVPESYDEGIIQQIVSLGHRAGYHYESLTTCNGDMEAAYEDFCRNLEKLRKLVTITTACAHGSPKSKWNSQDIWNQYDIHALGIEYEPMLDTDFSHTLYLTDTGRRWDGYKVSVRSRLPLHRRYHTCYQRHKPPHPSVQPAHQHPSSTLDAIRRRVDKGSRFTEHEEYCQKNHSINKIDETVTHHRRGSSPIHKSCGYLSCYQREIRKPTS